MLNVIIPYYESDTGKREVLTRCLFSLQGHDNTLLLMGKQPSLAKAIADMLDYSFNKLNADYTVFSNDDLTLEKGSLADLCEKDAVTLPFVNGGFTKVFHAHMFCLPKTVWEKVGNVDPNFNIYWWDTDYALRLLQNGVNIKLKPTVNVLHPEAGRTLRSMPSELERADMSYFVQKHGRTYIDVVKEY